MVLSDVSMWLTTAIICTCVSKVRSLQVSTYNITGLAGSSLLLNCTVDHPHVGQVIWIRPGDNVVVSRDNGVVNANDEPMQNRLMVIGDYTKGQYHLLITYALFPRDAGTWICSSESVTHRVNVVLLVRPNIEIPSISPSAESIASAAEDGSLKTFTCTAQFAFPPVQLAWIKKIGPDVPYHTTLPSIVLSRSGTMSSSVRLILSNANARSVFVCITTHPAFFGKVYSKTLHFQLSMDGETQPLVQERESKTSSARSSLIQFDTLDRVFILLVVSMIVVALTVGILMNRYRSKWQLDVPMKRIDQNLNTKSLCEVSDDEEGSQKRMFRDKRRQFVRKVLAALFLLMLLICSLVLAFPVYYKGVTIPTVAADEMTSVLAGSALWLDCRRLFIPPTSVLEVNWLYNGQPFYHQYFSNGQNAGFPHNSTKGFMIGARVSSQGLGQITIWPVAPGEDGQYTCRGFLSSGNDGVTEERGKSTAVFVSMGPIVNYVLIGLLAVSLMSSLGLAVLFVFHTLRIPRKEEAVKGEDEDV